jgi:thiol-disulfide isomerase/thioredoxin
MDFIWSSDSDIASLEDLTGSIVVIDFWATWCGPCIASFPKVRELQKHFEGHPVVILGITSPQGAHFGQEGRQQVESNDEEFALMPGFMEWKEMTWPVVFTEENVFNPDYGVQGIPHVTILDTEGRVRHNALHPGNDLPGKVDKINELLEEAGLPTPGPYDDSAA